MQAEVVFLLTDTMASRKEIMRGALEYNGVTKLVVETRLGETEGYVCALNPNVDHELEQWWGGAYDDPPEDPDTCNTKVSVGPTGWITAAYACFFFTRWWEIEQSLAEGVALSEGEQLPFGIRWSAKPFDFMVEPKAVQVSAKA